MKANISETTHVLGYRDPIASQTEKWELIHWNDQKKERNLTRNNKNMTIESFYGLKQMISGWYLWVKTNMVNGKLVPILFLESFCKGIVGIVHVAHIVIIYFLVWDCTFLSVTNGSYDPPHFYRHSINKIPNVRDFDAINNLFNNKRISVVRNINEFIIIQWYWNTGSTSPSYPHFIHFIPRPFWFWLMHSIECGAFYSVFINNIIFFFYLFNFHSI